MSCERKKTNLAVFCSLLELAWIGYLSREEEVKPQPAPAPAAPKECSPSPSPVHSSLRHRHTNGIDEETALLRDNDYGYIPPGFGLNGNLKNAMRSLGGRCSCELKETKEKDNYQSLPPPSSSASPPVVPSRGQTSRQRKDHLSNQIDKLSAILFPSLFSLFNIAYW